MYGYQCCLLTDTEVITYLIDFLVRRRGLSYEEASQVLAAPFWSTIQRREPEERARLTYLRSAFSGMLVTGPFSILVGFTGGILALNDRLKLRSMVVGRRTAPCTSPARRAPSGSSPQSWTASFPPKAGSRWSTGWKGGGECMSTLSFTKMQGCGNDYIYIDCFRQQVEDPGGPLAGKAL